MFVYVHVCEKVLQIKKKATPTYNTTPGGQTIEKPEHSLKSLSPKLNRLLDIDYAHKQHLHIDTYKCQRILICHISGQSKTKTQKKIFSKKKNH